VPNRPPWQRILADAGICTVSTQTVVGCRRSTTARASDNRVSHNKLVRFNSCALWCVSWSPTLLDFFPVGSILVDFGRFRLILTARAACSAC
jgi:hypothetical protein